MATKTHSTPRLVTRFLNWFCKDELMESIEGDLYEQYQSDRSSKSKIQADLAYFNHVLNFIRPFALKKTNTTSRNIMTRHYFSFAFRNILKHKTHSAMNILSLAIGIACFIFIFTYVKDEMSYDKFHTDYQRIYRIPIDFINDNGERLPDATTPPALAPALKNEFAEIEEVVRIFPMWGGSYMMGPDPDNLFQEEEILRVDPSFLKLFDFTLLKGIPDSALNQPTNIILTERMAKKYFGDTAAMGKSVIVNGRTEREFTVTGIVNDVPYNSHFTFDFLMPITFSNIDENWGWYNYYTYVKLQKNASIEQLEPKLQPMFESHIQIVEGELPNIIYSQALEDIHLHSQLKWELGQNGDINNIYFFSALGIFVLIVSLINYLNLSIASAFNRSKEVGVRKVFGAYKRSIVNQLLVESFLLLFTSLVLGTLFSEVLLTAFEPLMGKKLSVFQPENLQFLALMSIVIVSIGLLAGLYPAFHMSSFSISRIVKGMLGTTGSSGSVEGIRKGLLVFQFSISVIMIVGTITVYQQLEFFRKYDLGFNKEQLMIVPANSQSDLQGFKENISQLASVQSVGLSDGVLGGLNWTFTAGYPESVLINYTVVDPEYIETMEFEFLAGRNFSREVSSDSTGYNIIVNEKALEDLGKDLSIVGEQFPLDEEEDSLIMGRIIGVVKDFHFTSFKNEIKPYAFFYRNNGFANASIKLSSSNVNETIQQVENAWSEVNPGAPFDYYFLDDSFQKLHSREENLSTILFDLTILAIFVAFIGMFAITNIVIKDKIKEIAIRKVLGAHINGLILLITKNFMVLVIMANVIAIPISYFIMKNWLDGFVYRMDLSLWIFVGSAFLTFVIAWMAIGYQSYKAARRRLVDSLVYE